MHASCYQWVSEKVAEYRLTSRRTLEVGSQDVNGSIRPLFASDDYLGVDMEPGVGVDLTMNAHELGFPDADFDVVVSAEMLEHDSQFWLSMQEMGRVLRPGGFLLVTARGNGMPQHDYPGDFYRFMPSSFNTLFELAGCQVLEITEDTELPGVFGIGMRRSGL